MPAKLITGLVILHAERQVLPMPMSRLSLTRVGETGYHTVVKRSLQSAFIAEKIR